MPKSPKVDSRTALVENGVMSMNIKSAEAHDLARELAALEHTTVTDAVTMSLREALAIRRAEATKSERLARMRSIADRFSEIAQTQSGPTLWQVNEELYDDEGLPR